MLATTYLSTREDYNYLEMDVTTRRVRLMPSNCNGHEFVHQTSKNLWKPFRLKLACCQNDYKLCGINLQDYRELITSTSRTPNQSSPAFTANFNSSSWETNQSWNWKKSYPRSQLPRNLQFFKLCVTQCGLL